MYEFQFVLNWDETIDLFYEYVISKCGKYFDVPNKNIAFRINSDTEKKFLLIVIYSDESENFLNHLEINKFDYTKSGYNSIINEKIQQQELKFVDNKICLSNREIRYIKFSRERLIIEVGKMFCEMSNELLKLDKHNAELFYDSLNNKFTYIGTVQKYNKRWKNRKSQVIDLSSEMKRYYI